ncbi:MAG TPA: ankyrin repeat domain-containing protein [Phycisphaerales bacterium]|nr:ankyrin repeat domain-containing protein [Phycisphaerales bacterium]
MAKRSLISAAESGNIALLDKLIAAGGNINQRDAKGHSPLGGAVDRGQLKAAQFLLDRGASLSIRSQCGWSPLHIAVHRNHQDLCELLLHRGISLESKTAPARGSPDGYTALHMAISASTDAICSLLVSHGANIDATTHDGETPMHLAASVASASKLKLLIDAKARIDLLNSTGQTPLHIAAKSGNVAIVQQLITAGSNASALDLNGASPGGLARLANYEDIATLLRQCGDSVSVGKRRVRTKGNRVFVRTKEKNGVLGEEREFHNPFTKSIEIEINLGRDIMNEACFIACNDLCVQVRNGTKLTKDEIEILVEGTMVAIKSKALNIARNCLKSLTHILPEALAIIAQIASDSLDENNDDVAIDSMSRLMKKLQG